MLEAAELGPIDPQILVGNRFVPAKAIENQFKQATADIVAEPKRIPAWVPMLRDLGPSLLEECSKALDLSRGLVSQWLRERMFNGDPDAAAKAERVAAFLADYERHRSHARPIHVEDLAPLDVKISYLSADPDVENLVRDVWIAVDLTMLKSATYKLLENHTAQGLYHQAQINVQPAPTGRP